MLHQISCRHEWPMRETYPCLILGLHNAVAQSSQKLPVLVYMDPAPLGFFPAVPYRRMIAAALPVIALSSSCN
jgi:hypothetical protein